MEEEVVELATEVPGVVLRELTAADLDAYDALVDRNREHLNQRGDHAFERDASFDDIRRYFEAPWDDNVRFGVWSGSELVGRVDLNPIAPPNWVLGYWLAASATGRGIATAACRAVIAHAPALGASELYAGVTHGNAASVAVLRRLGFEHLQDLADRSRWRLPLVDDPPPPVLV